MEISKHSLRTCKKPLGFREFEIRPDWVKFKNFFVLVISLFNTKLILSKLNIGLKVKKNPYFLKISLTLVMVLKTTFSLTDICACYQRWNILCILNFNVS